MVGDMVTRHLHKRRVALTKETTKRPPRIGIRKVGEARVSPFLVLVPTEAAKKERREDRLAMTASTVHFAGRIRRMMIVRENDRRIFIYC
jgi:hypothetical protein